MSFSLSNRSLGRLDGVHPDLVKVVKRAIQITPIDFGVTEGVRTFHRQAQLVEQGASQTMKSRHITGHAVDLVAYLGQGISWHGPLYYRISDAMKKAAVELDVNIEWGGDWKSFFDGPHFQLSHGEYPANDKA